VYPHGEGTLKGEQIVVGRFERGIAAEGAVRM